MRKKVGILQIGDKLQYAGIEYTIDSFPTRTSLICSTENPGRGLPSSMKIPISKILAHTTQYVVI